MSAEYLNPPTLSAPPGAMYSQAVRVRAAETLYISGQVARDPAGKLVGEGDVVAQYRQVWKNLGLALDAVGLGYDHLVKTTTYVTNIQHAAGVRKVREELFQGSNPPTSTLLVITGLASPDYMVEIEAIAVVD